MSDRRIIAIVGATGIQGGSVARAFLSDPSWQVRGLTRDVDSKSAQKAKGELPGVQWVQADVNDRPSLLAAFRGAFAVAGVTQAFDSSIVDNREQERQQGINIVDAANDAQASVLVWSSLPDSRQTSHGEFTGIKHTFLKAEVAAYIRSQRQAQKLRLRAFVLMPGSYMQNYLHRFPPQRKQGEVVFSLPASADVKLDLMDVDEWGQLLHSLLSLPPEQSALYADSDIAVCGERLGGRQMAADYAAVTGEPARYETKTDEDFLTEGGDDSRVKELLEMFRYYDRYGLFGETMDLQTAKAIYPLSTFKQHLQRTGYRAGQRDEKYKMES
jgi:uncharacterized protein YbjT (DUF2867 family)